MTESSVEVPLGGTKELDRRQFLYGGVLLGAVGAGMALKPRRAAPIPAPGALESAVPLTIGPYRFLTQSGLVVPQQDALSERIYDQVLTRIYGAPGLPAVMLLIAYGSAQDSGLALHRPEICYFGAGYEIGPMREVPFAAGKGKAGEASYLTATRPDRREQIFYWTRIGDRFVTSATNEKWIVIKANLHRELPDGVLVRMSTVAPSDAEALPALQHFNTWLVRSLGSDGRQLLLGV